LGAVGRVRRRISPLTIEELRDVTDIWVDSVMSLATIDLRKMEMLAWSQDRLFEQAASQRFNRPGRGSGQEKLQEEKLQEEKLEA
jgi:DSF synthase